MNSAGPPDRDRGEFAARVNTPLSTIYDFFSGLIRDSWRSVASWNPVKRFFVFVAILTAVVFTLAFDIPSLATFRAWAEQSGGGFILLFSTLYVLITLFPVPRTLLTLAAGVLFGPVLGSVIALGATTVSALLALLIVRGLLGDWMRPRLTHPAVERINLRLRQRGWLAITSLRMIAAVPFSVLNYVAALTSVPVWAFTVATLIGSAPGTIATVVLGDAVTGDGDWRALLITVILALLGIFGIFLDQKLPVKSPK